MKPLFIIIKKKYFNEILEGTKTEEFREQSEYWKQKLSGPEDQILFQAGYSKGSPRMLIEYHGYTEKTINHEFFGSDPVKVFALQLGKILQLTSFIK